MNWMQGTPKPQTPVLAAWYVKEYGWIYGVITWSAGQWLEHGFSVRPPDAWTSIDQPAQRNTVDPSSTPTYDTAKTDRPLTVLPQKMVQFPDSF